MLRRKVVIHRQVRNKSNKKLFLFSLIASICLFLGLLGFYMVSKLLHSQPFISPLSGNSSEQSPTADINSLKDILKEKNIPFYSVLLTDEGSYIVTLPTGQEVIFSKNKPFTMQVSSLQLVMSRLTIEGKRFMRLDFRFNNPIITLQ